MNEASPVLEDGHATVMLAEETSAPADYDARVATGAAPEVYAALTEPPAGFSRVDFFAPPRRQSAGQAVPTYRALTEPPADRAKILHQILAAPPSSQSAEQTVASGKMLIGAIAS